MDLYGDLPAPKDGSEVFQSSPQIQLKLSDSQKKKIQQQHEEEHMKHKKAAEAAAELKSNVDSKKVAGTTLQFAPMSLLKPRSVSKKPLKSKPLQKSSIASVDVQNQNQVDTPKPAISAQQNPVPIAARNEDSTKNTSLPTLSVDKEENSIVQQKKEENEDEEKDRAKEQVKKSRTRASFILQDIQDEYDPAKPNNYELYVENAIRREQEEARARSLRKQMKEQEKKMQEMADARKREVLQGNTEPTGSAGRGRGRGFGRGRDLIMPAWMKQKKEEEAKQVGK